MKIATKIDSVGSPVSVAVIGCGKHARNRLIPVIQSRQDVFRLAAICDIDPKITGEADFPCCGLSLQTDVAKTLARDDIHGVIVATPAEAHAKLTRLALEAGKYVLVEKPPAISSHEWESACSVAPTRVMVGFMKRFIPAYSILTEWLLSKSLAPNMVVGSFRSGHYLSMEAFLRDFGIHLLDLVCAFLGIPIKLIALVAPLDKPQALTVSITYPDAIATLSFSWSGGWTQHTENIELSGAGWLARVDNARRLDIYPAEILEPNATATPMHLAWEPNYPVSWREIKDQNLNGYEPELLAFANLCLTGQAKKPDYRDGLMAMRLCEAIIRSVTGEGETVVLK